jgi:hypothetical protein
MIMLWRNWKQGFVDQGIKITQYFFICRRYYYITLFCFTQVRKMYLRVITCEYGGWSSLRAPVNKAGVCVWQSRCSHPKTSIPVGLHFVTAQ